MNTFDSLIESLKSADSRVRDQAALDLMDIGDDRAVPPLIEAILNPENLDYRGTLVYALSAFNCFEHLEFLVDLVLTGNFEVSWGAFTVLEELEPTSIVSQRIQARLSKYHPEDLPFEHSLQGFEALVELSSVNKE